MFTKIPSSLPNLITAGRMLLTPLAVIFCARAVILKEAFSALAGLFVFIIIVGSDIADGVIARKLSLTTTEGAHFDILADFFYRFSLLLLFCLTGKTSFFLLTSFSLLFVFFITGYCPFRLLTSEKLLLYSGKSVPVLITVLLGLLITDDCFQFPLFLNTIIKKLEAVILGMTIISIMIKLFCRGNRDSVPLLRLTKQY
ncbi:MAG: CDP-alcohol phosphatidyltransferase family protein [Candidatus Schekmanbacteria bacterium]|nr:CDP-alcohol phosphatidyltransferase family protein [Candidatus Schekmanbacteria bacterium]